METQMGWDDEISGFAPIFIEIMNQRVEKWVGVMVPHVTLRLLGYWALWHIDTRKVEGVEDITTRYKILFWDLENRKLVLRPI